MSELFKAKWKWTEDESKQGSRKRHKAAEGAALGASAAGGYLMGNPAGEKLAERHIHNKRADRLQLVASNGQINEVPGKKSVGSALKAAAKTKRFKVGAAVGAAGVAGSAINQHAAKKKGVIVRKNHTELFVAAWREEIEKRAGASKIASLVAPYRGAGKQQKLNGLLKPYKGGVPKPDRKLPFQAAKAKAALARRKGQA